MLAGAELLSMAGAIALAFLVYPHGVAYIEEQHWQLGVWAAPIVFFSALVIGRLVIGFALFYGAKRVSAAGHAHIANRLLGTIPGAVNGLLLATIAAMFLLVVPLNDSVSHMTEESALANRLAAPVDWFQAKLQPIFDPAIQRTLTRLTINPDSRETIRLPFKVNDPKPRPDLEAAMLELVNRERAAQRLSPLQFDAQETQVARDHSADMLIRGYFSHMTPEGKNPFDRMRESHVRFYTAGENLAYARTLKMAHQGLMNSPGHRANILQPAFRHVGIGIMDGGRYGLMVTQEFRN